MLPFTYLAGSLESTLCGLVGASTAPTLPVCFHPLSLLFSAQLSEVGALIEVVLIIRAVLAIYWSFTWLTAG